MREESLDLRFGELRSSCLWSRSCSHCRCGRHRSASTRSRSEPPAIVSGGGAVIVGASIATPTSTGSRSRPRWRCSPRRRSACSVPSSCPPGGRRVFSVVIAGAGFIASGVLAVRRLRSHPAADAADRRVDEPRPARRAHPGARRRLRAGSRARLVGRQASRPRRRVLRAARRCGRRHGVLRLCREPDDALPRARVVLDLALHPGRARHAPQGVARGRPEVPDRRKLRVGDPAVRVGADLRRHRRARLQCDPHGDGRRRLAVRGRDGDDHRGAGVQGFCGAVPHVDARRLRGRADAGDSVHVRSDEGRRARRDAAGPRDGVPGAGRDLVDRDRRARRDLARDRQLRGAGADGASSASSRTPPSRRPASC